MSVHPLVQINIFYFITVLHKYFYPTIIATTTTVKPPTTATTASYSTAPTTTYSTASTTGVYSNTTFTPPVYGNCSRYDRTEYYENNLGCYGNLTTSVCRGSCVSSIVSNFEHGVVMETCYCCKPTGIYNHTDTLLCPGVFQREDTITYERFTGCLCQPCDNAPFNGIILISP